MRRRIFVYTFIYVCLTQLHKHIDASPRNCTFSLHRYARTLCRNTPYVCIVWFRQTFAHCLKGHFHRCNFHRCISGNSTFYRSADTRRQRFRWKRGARYATALCRRCRFIHIGIDIGALLLRLLCDVVHGSHVQFVRRVACGSRFCRDTKELHLPLMVCISISPRALPAI